MIEFNEGFWFALSIVALFAFSYKNLKQSIISAIDERTNLAVIRYNESKKAFESAENKYKELQKLAKQHKQDMKDMVEHAQKESKMLSENTIKKIQDIESKKTALNKDRISILETSSIDEVRKQFVDEIIEDFKIKFLDDSNSELRAKVLNNSVQSFEKS